MKNIHILPVSVFTNSFIEFINSNFPVNNHYFFLYGDFNDEKKVKADNTFQINDSPVMFIKLIFQMNKAEKLYIHSLFNQWLVRILFFQPWLLGKSSWIVWGGDLYYYVTRDKCLKSNIFELMRAFVIKNIGGLITHIHGDYELAKLWYGAKGKYYYSFMYTSNLYKEYCLNKSESLTNKIIIQIGNSADPGNNHIEVLNKLQKYNNSNIEVICPLSYGNQEYVNRVINYGTEIYGHKFIAITEFMPFDKYLDILARIDIAIFNHKRQQAMGNITTLLGLGKKVFIREEITTWQFCLDHDLKVYSANGDFEDLFEEMDEEIKQKNIENVKIKFSEEKLLKDWRRIFDA